ncbi:helix-turn-helix domain-containing protein [Massilia sp. CCM 8695]|uniref:Helix-turn-helix domain-containing protein n=1 Tax=Massilia frigida TaxID=2609281 RepID=A0ABX0NF25_9BURK|nr:helix-turn-helix transcriptional regulator [Massilia frigida]NHZ81851.1 helix-turn-helix domain-containing protein [Massilia frigida]
MNNDLGKTLQDLRERSGLTQGQLAERLGITQQSIAKWEAGKAAPRASILDTLAATLGVSTAFLLQARSVNKRARGVTSLPQVLKASEEPEAAHAPIPPLQFKIDAQFPELASNMKPSEYASAMKAMIAPVLEPFYPDGRWDSVVHGSSIAWKVDYMDDRRVANFVHSSNLSMWNTLRIAVPRTLWELATLRAHLKDSRTYMLIMTIANGGGEQDPSDSAMSQAREVRNGRLLRELTEQAAILNMFLFVSRTPADVISILDSSYLIFPDMDGGSAYQ